MELALKVISWLVLGAIVGLVLFRIFIWRLRRAIDKATPPKGSRPSVRVVVDDVIYDVSESLVRGPDREDGSAQWYYEGPQHVRMFGSMELLIDRPPPADTVVHSMVTGNARVGGRFLTMDEIRRQVPGLP